MSKSFKKLAFVAGTVLLPTFALAQDVTSIFIKIQEILNVIIPIVMTLALLYFFWGLATYILGGSADEEKRAAGRSMMIYGVIALFVMAAVWGLTGVLANTFGIRQGTGAPPVAPLIPTL